MLRWNADFGDKEEYWRAKIRDGQRAPDQFYDRPNLDDAELFYYTAFIDLGTERQYGMTVGPIPMSAARDYAAEYDVPFDFFWSVIRQVDGECMKMWRSANKEAQPDKEEERRSTVKRERLKGRPIKDK